MRINYMILEVSDGREGSLGFEGGLLSQIINDNPRTHSPTSDGMNMYSNKAHTLPYRHLHTHKAQCNCTGLKDMIHKPLNRHA